MLYGHVGTCNGLQEAAPCNACLGGDLSLVDAILRKRHSVAMCRLARSDVRPDCVQVLSVTAKGRLPQASVTLMGSGLMEWSRERDRVINVSAGQSAACIQRVALINHRPNSPACLWTCAISSSMIPAVDIVSTLYFSAWTPAQGIALQDLLAL